MKVKVSCVQMYPSLGKPAENAEKMCRFIDDIMASEPNTDLIVFPELCVSGYECGRLFYELAEESNCSSSAFRLRIIEKAAEYGIYVIFGFPERSGDCLYNSAMLIDDKGTVSGVYRKCQLFDTEKNWFSFGHDYPVFDTRFGKIGIMICFDAIYPEIARIMALRGADLLVVSTNWEKPYLDDYRLTMSARCLDNILPMACANRVGRDCDLDFFGVSRITDPVGKVILEMAEDEEGFISAELDLEESAHLRKSYYTMFADRQPETYKPLTETF